MTEPKFEAPEIITRHSFSDDEEDEGSPEQTAAARAVMQVGAAGTEGEASVVVKREEESMSYASIAPIPIEFSRPGTGLTARKEYSRIGTAVMVGAEEIKTQPEIAEKRQEVPPSLPSAILGYEAKKKKMTHIKITDLQEARKNRDKESYILVSLCVNV